MKKSCTGNKNDYLDIGQSAGSAGITRYELSKRTGIQFQIIDNYYRNKVKRYDNFVLDRICTALDCELTEIIAYQK